MQLMCCVVLGVLVFCGVAKSTSLSGFGAFFMAVPGLLICRRSISTRDGANLLCAALFWVIDGVVGWYLPAVHK
jgi:hypothetical protein